MALPSIRTVLARLRYGRRSRTDLIVIHTAECGETRTAAENVASWFQNPAAKGSAHVTFDNDSEVMSAGWDEICAGARGGDVNKRTVHAEHASRAARTRADWADEYSTAMLWRSRSVLADVALCYGIPAVWLTPAQVRRSQGDLWARRCDSHLLGEGWAHRPWHGVPEGRLHAARRGDHGRSWRAWRSSACGTCAERGSAAVRRWVAGVNRNQVGALPNLERNSVGLHVAALRDALSFLTGEETLALTGQDLARIAYTDDLI
ncbi:MAG: N-acetylmuramoyl-L-alanine amidase [Microthrixaceae bacterium]